MSAYYNEFDPYAAQWLRNLIAAGHIAPGDVDERSIEDVKPEDLKGYTQVHMFAGVGVWSLALRRAGWEDNRPVWTGSCPCQPFSAAGKGGGVNDERHLWPAWFQLIAQREPSVVFGEQVASKDGLGWLDLVQTDLEGASYANAAVDLCSAGVGAPHIRQRLWFVAERLDNTDSPRLEGHAWNGSDAGRETADRPIAETGLSLRMADPQSIKQQRRESDQSGERESEVRGRCIPGSRMADTNSPTRREDTRGTPSNENPDGPEGRNQCQTNSYNRSAGDGQIRRRRMADTNSTGSQQGKQTTQADRHRSSVIADGSGAAAGPTNGIWSDVDWLICRDDKFRPVEPGTFPLANGVTNRVGRLRAYGNAINAEAAKTFIEAYLDV